MSEPPWSAERRYHRPDVRHTAGLTWDDIAPTAGDDRELKRALRAQDEPWKQAWTAGLESRPNPFPDDEGLTETWCRGRWERNRRRQDAVWAWFRGKSKRRRRRRSS
jgi:hypothetical protein